MVRTCKGLSQQFGTVSCTEVRQNLAASSRIVRVARVPCRQRSIVDPTHGKALTRRNVIDLLNRDHVVVSEDVQKTPRQGLDHCLQLLEAYARPLESRAKMNTC